MSGLVRQGFGSGGTIAQIIRDGYGSGTTGPGPTPPDTNLPTFGTIQANYWQNLKGPNLDRMLRDQALDRDFGESIRADYRKTVLGIDPVRDEIAALEAIAAEPIPEYRGPKPVRPDIRTPSSPIAARAVMAASAPLPVNVSRFGAALSARDKPSRFSK